MSDEWKTIPPHLKLTYTDSSISYEQGGRPPQFWLFMSAGNLWEHLERVIEPGIESVLTRGGGYGVVCEYLEKATCVSIYVIDPNSKFLVHSAPGSLPIWLCRILNQYPWFPVATAEEAATGVPAKSDAHKRAISLAKAVISVATGDYSVASDSDMKLGNDAGLDYLDVICFLQSEFKARMDQADTERLRIRSDASVRLNQGLRNQQRKLDELSSSMNRLVRRVEDAGWTL